MRPASEVLLTAGAAQAFSLVAQALRPAYPLVIHPQFTEPEAALREAGHDVRRLVLEPPFTLDPFLVPEEADLVMLGNPTNPTSVLHPITTVEQLARPGRILVVDEAFADTIPAEAASVAHRRDLPGLLVIRSLTKTWALAGLRIGYVLGEASLLQRLRAIAPLWPVSTPALAAAIACSTTHAVAEANHLAHALSSERSELLRLLSDIPGVTIAAPPTSSFLLLHLPGADRLRSLLRDRGWAVRRGDTFPGLGPDWLRVAVRDIPTSQAFAAALRAVIAAPGECLAAAPAEALEDPVQGWLGESNF
jgi:histidinol-phosphate aminotransferase